MIKILGRKHPQLLRSAHFATVENSDQMGIIVFSGGDSGVVVMSKAEALTQVELAHKQGKIIEIEIEPLRQQILNSSLPATANIHIIEVYIYRKTVPPDPVEWN